MKLAEGKLTIDIALLHNVNYNGAIWPIAMQMCWSVIRCSNFHLSIWFGTLSKEHCTLDAFTLPCFFTACKHRRHIVPENLCDKNDYDWATFSWPLHWLARGYDLWIAISCSLTMSCIMLIAYSSLIVYYIASVSCLLLIHELNDVAAQHVIFLLFSVTWQHHATFCVKLLHFHLSATWSSDTFTMATTWHFHFLHGDATTEDNLSKLSNILRVGGFLG